jgi:hypothetical protein
MNRRRFLRTMIGTAVAPSLVWPFRKIFLPPARYWEGTSILRPDLFHGIPEYYEGVHLYDFGQVLWTDAIANIKYVAVDENNQSDRDCAEVARHGVLMRVVEIQQKDRVTYERFTI